MSRSVEMCATLATRSTMPVHYGVLSRTAGVPIQLPRSLSGCTVRTWFSRAYLAWTLPTAPCEGTRGLSSRREASPAARFKLCCLIERSSGARTDKSNASQTRKTAQGHMSVLGVNLGKIMKKFSEASPQFLLRRTTYSSPPARMLPAWPDRRRAYERARQHAGPARRDLGRGNGHISRSAPRVTLWTMGEHRETAPERMSAAVRASKIVSLRAAGATWAECARATGYANASSAYRSAKKWINKQSHEDRETMRLIEGARFDRLQLAVWSRALTGDLAALDRVLKISAARREMFGLNAPTRLVIEDGWLDNEIRTLADELGVSDPRDLVEAPPATGVASTEGAAPTG